MRGHAVTCSAAVRTTPEQCTCMCVGALHGGPHTERAAAILVPEADRKRYSNSRVTSMKSDASKAAAANTSVGPACTNYAVTDAIDAFVHSDPAQEAEDLRATLAGIVQPFAATLLAADLDASQSQQIEVACTELHLLCALCAEILRLTDAVQEMTKQVSEMVAGDVVAACVLEHPLEDVLQEVLRQALQHSFVIAFPPALDPLSRRLLQLVGMITCPDIGEHSDVQEYCVKPLMATWVTPAMGDWINSGFADAATTLARRRTSRIPRKPRARRRSARAD